MSDTFRPPVSKPAATNAGPKLPAKPSKSNLNVEFGNGVPNGARIGMNCIFVFYIIYVV